jgi:hypothetical protein
MTRLNATVLGVVVGGAVRLRAAAGRLHPVWVHGRQTALWRLPGVRNAAKHDACKSGTHGRDARAAHGAKEPALGRHGQRHGALALKVLLEA